MSFFQGILLGYRFYINQYLDQQKTQFGLVLFLKLMLFVKSSIIKLLKYFQFNPIFSPKKFNECQCQITNCKIWQLLLHLWGEFIEIIVSYLPAAALQSIFSSDKILFHLIWRSHYSSFYLPCIRFL